MPTLAQVNSDPEFQELNYKEQTKARMDIFSRAMGQDPEFQALPRGEKIKALNSVVFSPPAMGDPQTQRYLNKISQGIQQGDEEALGFAKKEVYLATLGKASLIANTVDRYLVSPFLESLETSEGIEQWDHADIVADPERRKIVEYFDMALSQDQGLAQKVNTMKTVIGGGATLAEFGLLFGIGAGTTMAPRAIGKLFTAPTRSILSNAANLTKAAESWAKIGQAVLHAGATTTLGISRDIANDLITESFEEDPAFRETTQKNLRWMGGYFLGDIAINLVLDIGLPMAGGALKIFKGWPEGQQQEFKTLFKRVMSGEDIDPKQWAQLTAGQREAVLRTQSAVKTFNNVEQMDRFSALQMVGSSRGWNITQTKKGYRMVDNLGNKRNVNSLDKINETLLRDAYGRASNIADETAGAVAYAGDRWAGSKIITAKLNDLPKNAKPVMAQAMAPQGGRYTREQLEAAGKIFMKATGANDNLIKTVTASADGGSYKLMVGRKEIISVPKGNISPAQEREIASGLMDKLGEFRGKRLPTAVDFSEEVKAIYPNRKLLTPGFVDSLARERLNGELLQEGNKWILRFGGDRLSFDSLQEAGDSIVRATYNLDDVVAVAKQRYGITVRVNETSGELIAKKGPQIISRADNLEDLLKQNPSWEPKIPGQWGPNFTIVDNEIGVRYRSKVATGNKQDLAKFLDNFTDEKKMKTITNREDVKLKLHPVRGQFEVEVPQLGYRQTFDNITEAQSFLNGWQEFDNLNFMANRKGFRLEFTGGQWTAYSVDGAYHTAKNLDDIKAYLRDTAPVPEWAPELSGLAKETFTDIKLPNAEGHASSIYGIEAMAEPDYSLKTLGKTWVSPLQTELEAMMKEGGNPAIMEHYRSVEKTRDFLSGRAHEFYRLVDSAFEVGGKKLRKKSVQKVGAILGAGGDEDALKRLRVEIGFTDAELRAAENVRQLFGTDHMSGLAKQFDIPFDLFQQQYLPAFRKGVTSGRKKFTNPHSAIQASMDGNAVPKMQAFFKHARYDELQKVATSGDIRQTLLGYYNLGMREKYLGPLLDEVKNFHKTTDKRLWSRYGMYLSQLGGIPQGWSEETIKKASVGFLKKLGFKDVESADIVQTMMGMGYMNALGLRPALVIRNMNQIWTMLGPWVGNDWVKRSIRRVIKDDGQLFNFLKSKNVVRGKLPLFGVENIDRNSILGRFVHKALGWYQSSDDFTRAVGYVTGMEKFDDALKRLKAGSIKPGDEFSRHLRLDSFGPDVKAQILKYIDEGDELMRQGLRDKANFRYSLGQELYSTRLTKHAFFEYSKGNGPAAFRGTMGKIFGMFGTYPMYYVDNVRRALSGGTTADKLAFATRFVGNTTALYGAFAAFGIRMEAFKFWNPMVFTGGPFYEMFNTVLSAAGGDTRAMKNLTGIREGDDGLTWSPFKSEFVQWFSPFGFMTKDLADSVQFAKDGDPYRALLTASGFSLFDEQ